VHRTRLLAAALLALASWSGCTRSRPGTETLPSGEQALRATVIEVVDGDTLDVRLAGERERIRLLGVDTPETVKPDSPVECYGPEASAHLRDLLAPGTDVLLQRDRQARDRFGRLLVYLWRASDRRFVNQTLLEDGYAQLLVIEPNTARRPALAAAERSARAARRGLWGSCPSAEQGG
jgi:micrococcal nuclease